MALVQALSVQAVPADEIDDDLEAELLASLPAEEREEHLARRRAEQEQHRRAQVRAANAAPLARRRPGDPRSVAEAAERVRPVALAREQLLPVVPALADLLPDAGLARGSMITVGATGGGGATALALALAAAPSAAGSWVAAVGLPQVGLAAAAEHGLALERFAVIRTPPDDQWATVVAALVGAFDVVLLGPAPTARLGEARRLATRARERGSVLVTIDPAGRGLLEVDLRLTVVGSDWLGLGDGHGHLRGRRLEVEATGRRRASRPRRASLVLLDPSDHLLAEPDPPVEPDLDTDRVVDARRERVRRVASQPLPEREAAAETWSDVG